MIGGILLILLLFALNQPMLKSLKSRFPFMDISLLNKLYWYHCVFWGVYYTYQLFNPADSQGYYLETVTDYDSWLSAFGTDKYFIIFAGYPFAEVLGFSYEAMMALFSWFGYIGFVYFYIFFKENIKTNPKFWGIELITLFLFLPNMHFWTVAFSKGSLVFLGISLFAYAMRVPQKRLLALLVGSFIVFNIRPHMFLFLGAGALVGYFTGQERVPFYQKMLVYVGFIGALVIFSDQILAMANINLEEGVVNSFEQFATNRAENLSESGSGVDINDYPIPLKLATFWFRPLFFDAPGLLGIFVSFENLLYIILMLKLFDKDFVGYIKRSSSLVKMSLTIFLTSSLALAFVMANLGIAMRQKSQVMYFLFFVLVSFLDYKRQEKIRKYKLWQQQQQQQAQEGDLMLNTHA